MTSHGEYKNDQGGIPESGKWRTAGWMALGALALMGGITGVIIGCLDASMRGNDTTPNFYVLVVFYGFIFGAAAGLTAAAGGAAATALFFIVRKKMTSLAVIPAAIGSAALSTFGWRSLLGPMEPASFIATAVPWIALGTAATSVTYLFIYRSIARPARP